MISFTKPHLISFIECFVALLCLDLQSDRLQKVLEFVSTVHDLCAVLGMDFFSTVTEVHPSLNDSTGVQSKSISNDTLARLAKTVLTLKEDKKQRLHKVIHFTMIYFHIFFIFIQWLLTVYALKYWEFWYTVVFVMLNLCMFSRNNH